MKPLPGFWRGIALCAVCSLAIASAASGGGAPEVRALIRDGWFARAEATAKETLAALPPCAPDRVELECLCAEAMRRGDRRFDPETLARSITAVDLCTELFGTADPRRAEPLLHLGALRCIRREWGEAVKALRSARELQTRYRGEPSPLRSEAVTLSYLAIAVSAGEGDTERGLELLVEADRVLDTCTSGSDPDRAWVLDMRANVLWSQGRRDDAVAALAAAVAMRRETQRPDHPMLASSLLNFGTLLDQQGRLAEARAAYEEVLELVEQGTEITATRADVRLKLADILNDLGEARRAEAMFETALRDLEEHQQRGTAPHLRVLVALARLALERGDFAAVRNRLAATSGEDGGTSAALEPTDRASRELMQATVEIEDGRLDRAEECVARARAASPPGADALVTASCDEIEATAEAVNGNLERADEILISLAGRHPSGRGLCLLSRITLLRGDVEGALRWSLAAERVARGEWERGALGLEELSAVGLEDSLHRGTLDVAVDGAARLDRPDLAAEVWDQVLLSRETVYREWAQRLELARASSTPELEDAGKRLADARSRLAGLYVGRARAGIDPEQDPAVLEARTAREEAERELARATNTARCPARVPDIAALHARIPSEAGVVRYVFAMRPALGTTSARSLAQESRVFACVLGSRSDLPVILDLGPASGILELRARFLSGIRAHDRSETVAAGTRLRQVLLDPCLSRLGPIHILHVLPEAELLTLPFLALCTDSGESIAESGPCVNELSSEEDLLTTEAAIQSGRGLLAVGDPDSGGSWNSLPQARMEVAEVVAAFERGPFAAEGRSVLLGAEASELEVRREIQGRRIVHLATHGFYDGAAPAESTVPVRGPSNSRRTRLEPIAAPPALLPFLRSGLVLSQAAPGRTGPEADGILSTEEVLTLDLRGTEWVVLSGCDTALGEIRRTEGVLGLRRALRMAGARTVIGSLWPVEDRWAREWMAALYRARFERGLSTAEAVRRACLDVIGTLRKEKGEAPPSEWASFVAVGDGR